MRKLYERFIVEHTSPTQLLCHVFLEVVQQLCSTMEVQMGTYMRAHNCIGSRSVRHESAYSMRNTSVSESAFRSSSFFERICRRLGRVSQMRFVRSSLRVRCRNGVPRFLAMFLRLRLLGYVMCSLSLSLCTLLVELK